ncbi:MAG TPA: TIM barrel protein, partial [Limnochordia bacterium]
GRDFTGLFPVTAHVHLRDAGESWERVQLAPGTGKIDFGALFQGLRASGYDGALSIEYLRSLAGRDVSDDVRRMRELFLAWQDGGR